MKRQKIVILGGGMIGSAMAMDLKREDRHDVTVAELRPEVRQRLEARHGDRDAARPTCRGPRRSASS